MENSSLASHSPKRTANVKSVTWLRPLHWLVLGWGDMLRSGWISVIHGVAVAAFGSLLFLIARQQFWLLAGAFSGFLVVAPVLATGLYALSRALERGERADARLLLHTWTRWGVNRRADPASYWCLVRFGLLLALAGTGWVLTSAAFITLFTPVPIATPLDFLRYIVVASDQYVFELWLALGGVLAAPVFASSVISMQLLLDRHVSTLEAVVASWRVMMDNPGPMAVWAVLIMTLALLGFATALVGMIVIIPVLGHASWHAYRELLDVHALPERAAPRSRS